MSGQVNQGHKFKSWEANLRLNCPIEGAVIASEKIIVKMFDFDILAKRNRVYMTILSSCWINSKRLGQGT